MIRVPPRLLSIFHMKTICIYRGERMEKMCKDCKKTLQVSNFTKSKMVKDGYENKCKACRRNARKTHQKICTTCNTSFNTARREARFCSDNCQGIARRNRVVVNCSFCNKSVEIIKSKTKLQSSHYCDSSCRYEHLKQTMKGENNSNYRRIKKGCDGCGIEIDIQPYRLENHKYHFCSNDCYKNNIGRYFSGKNNSLYKEEIEILCDGCGKSIKRKAGQMNDTQNFCSHVCYLNNFNSMKVKNLEKRVCSECDEDIWNFPSQYEGKKKVFCSKHCKNIHYGRIYKGENHPSYNHLLTPEEREQARKYEDYYVWRKLTFDRDKFSCQKCGDNRGGNLVAHHILNYSEYPELRTELNNSITFCKECHTNFHNQFGYRKNSRAQVSIFLKEQNMN